MDGGDPEMGRLMAKMSSFVLVMSKKEEIMAPLSKPVLIGALLLD